MQATHHTKLHKALSAFTAFALALLMVPIVPGSTQVAAAATTTGYPVTSSADGFITGLVYDQYGDVDANALVTQDIDWDDAAKKATLTYPEKTDSTVQTNVAADAKTAAENDLKEKAEQGKNDAASKDVKDNKSADLTAAMEKWATDNESDFTAKAKADATTAIGASNIKEGTEVTVTATGTPTYGEKAGGAALTATTVTLNDSSYTLTNDKATVDNDSIAFGPSNPTAATTDSVTVSGSGVEVSDISSSGFKMKAVSAPASSTISLAFTYDAVVSAYSYTYAGSYGLTYKGFEYENWTCSKQYTYSYTDKEGTTVNGANPITVTLDGGKVTKEYSEAVPVTVSVNVAEAIPVTGKSLATGSTGQNGAYTYTVTTVNLFPEPASTKALGDISFSSTADIDLFEGVTFGHDYESVARGKLGDPATSSTHLSVAKKDDGIATATAILKGEDTTTVTWEYNGHTFTRSVTANVLPKEIDLSAFEFPADAEVSVFRLQGDIESRVLDAVNDQVRKDARAANQAAGISAEIGDDASYFANVSFDGFDTATGTEKQYPTLTWTDSEVGEYGNFVVKNAPSTLTVNEMRDEHWSDIALTLKSNLEITAENAETDWVREVPTASYEGHSLAYHELTAPSSVDGYSKDVKVDGGDGVHKLEFYALDDSTHEITRVKDVSFLLDTQAPLFLSASYATPLGTSIVDTGTTLVGKDTVQVTLGIADQPKGDGVSADIDSTGDNAARVSGLKEQPKVRYKDKESNTQKTPSLAQEGNLYSFSLGYDEDVETQSIEAYAIDNAGNELNWVSALDSIKVPADVLRLLADHTGPTMSVEWESSSPAYNGNFYDNARIMTVTIGEPFFDYIKQYQKGQVLGHISGSDGTDITLYPDSFTETPAGSNKWVYTYTFSTDADFSVTNLSVTDLVGHAAGASNESFTIDTVPPLMDVTFDNNNVSNGNYYNAPRTATITITEHNFSKGLVDIQPTAGAGNGDSVGAPNVSDWSNNGDVHTATVYFPGEGVYTLSVTGTDLANRALPSHSTSEFIIDTTTPQIQISGVDNRQAYSGSAQPGVTVQDTNISDATTIELSKISYPMSNDDANPYSESRSNATTEITASYPDAGQVVSNDGVYTLTVHAVDMAGNTADQAVTWSVNRFGSTYVLSDTTTKMLNNYLQGSKVSNVVVTEINPSGLNEGATAVELTHDTSNSTLKLGSDYGISASDSSGWSEYTYNVQKSNFDSDGSYRVLFHSEDVASNTSENTMKNKNASRTATAEVAFAVDDTAPIVSFIDLDSNGLYEESTHTAQVSIEDNLKLDTAEVKIDGEKALELDSAALSSSPTHSFDVPESASTHEIVVTAYDAAGNAETVAATNVTVTTDPVKLWMNNTPLFVGTIVGGIVVIGAIVAFAAMRTRRPSL